MSALPDTARLALDPAQLRAELPAPMLEARRWLLWQYEMRDGKPTKVPYYTSGGKRGTGLKLDSPEDVARLDTFDNTLRACASGSYAGIGFALGPDADGIHWQGIDLDKVSETPGLAELVKELPGYVERSPSGNGYHGIGIGKQFSSLGPNGSGIEAYAHGKYFTVTGEAVGGDLEDLAGFVADTLAPLHQRKREGSSEHQAGKVHVTPDQVRDLRSALLHLRSDDRDLWQRLAHALHELGDTGRGLWLEWSATSEKFDPADAARVWNSIKSADRTGYGAVFAAAQAGGWVNPAAGSSTRKESDKPPQDGETVMQPISARELFAMNFGEMIWNIQDILPAGTTLAFGKPKKGKSFLVLMIAISIAANRPVFGRRTSGCRVLYLGLEDSKRRLQRRAKGCAASLGIDADEFADRLHLDTRSARIDTGLLDELHAWMKAHPDTGLIVLDMLKKVTGATAGKSLYDEQSKVGDALTAFSHDYPALSIIVVHHSRKAESDDPFDLVSGTTGLSGSYDSLAAIADTDGARVLHLTGRDIEGAEIPLLMNDRGMYTLAMPDVDEQAVATMSSTRRRVFDAVPASIPQERAKIVEDTGLDKATVDQQLRKLKAAGLIKTVDHGMYQKTGKRWFDDPVVDFDSVIRNASRL